MRTLALAIVSMLLISGSGGAACASPSWEAVDQRAKTQVYQLNVAIKIRLGGTKFAQLADLSPRYHYPVFATTPDDKGFRVVGYGTCFPVQAIKHDYTYFLTNRHVVDYGGGMLQECKRFFAAMRLHAERTAAFSDVNTRYEQLMKVVNYALKKKMSPEERVMYQATVDSIWDTYDNHLSTKADPQRVQFNKYAALIGFEGADGYFLHRPGKATQAVLTARLYKRGTSLQPDLAILTAERALPAFELDSAQPTVGQPVQAIGYPIEQNPSAQAKKEYTPAIASGKVSAVSAGTIQFDATVSKGDSGGPLLNQRGKAIGVVARRAVNATQTKVSDKFATAIDAASVRNFAPELFGK